MRRSRRDERGFALLIVVLLVALLAITGAALLDIVSIDLSLSAEHSKTVRAQMVSDGGLREVLADVNSDLQLPEDTSCAGNGGGPGVASPNPCPNFRYNWASEVGGNFVKNPDGVNTAASPLDESNSAYARFTNLPASEENYTATVDLLRMVPLQESGHMVTRGLVYEVNTTGEVGGNRTRTELSAEIYKIVVLPESNLRRNHFR